MKPTIVLLGLAALAATSCVEQQNHWRRSQRLGSEVSLWQLPSAYVEALGVSGPPGASTPLIPTSGYSAAGAYETGLAPIFNVFRDELPSQTAPISMPPAFNVADAVANASSGPGFKQERELPRQEPIAQASFDHLPYAVAVPGRPGFVTIPGHANLGEIDVVGISSGTPVEVPAGAGSIQFRVP